MCLLWLLLLTAICSADPVFQSDDDSEPPRSVSEGDVIGELLHHRGDIKHGLPKWDVPVTVFITLYLSTVTKVNIEEGYVQLSGYMTQIWHDPRLRFRYSPPFHSIELVRLNTQDVWMPDIELYNVAPPGVKLLSLTDQVTVTYNGTVRYYPWVTMPVFCDDITDVKDNATTTFQCDLKMGSVSYDTALLNVDDRRDFNLLMSYTPKGQWVVTSIDVKRNEVTLPSLGKTYADVTYTVIVTKQDK